MFFILTSSFSLFIARLRDDTELCTKRNLYVFLFRTNSTNLNIFALTLSKRFAKKQKYVYGCVYKMCILYTFFYIN